MRTFVATTRLKNNICDGCGGTIEPGQQYTIASIGIAPWRQMWGDKKRWHSGDEKSCRKLVFPAKERRTQ